jgi:ankyrin repeat protein
LIETLGGDVNAQDDDQSTPIHIALNCFDPHDGGDIDVLHYLLGQKKVNVNIKGEYGDTLLHITCNNINHFPFDVFKLLIETMGCDVNAQDNRNYTPLHIAILFFNPCSAGDIAVLTYLLDRNDVNVNIKTNEGRNLLHLACISQLSKSRDSPKQNAEFDTILCQIVEIIVERCIGEVLNEVTL